jgi:hypothetical protein
LQITTDATLRTKIIGDATWHPPRRRERRRPERAAVREAQQHAPHTGRDQHRGIEHRDRSQWHPRVQKSSAV